MVSSSMGARCGQCTNLYTMVPQWVIGLAVGQGANVTFKNVAIYALS